MSTDIPAGSFTLTTDQLIDVLGSLLAFATMVERDTGAKAHYHGKTEKLVELADFIGGAFVRAAISIVQADPTKVRTAARDVADVAEVMAAGLDAYTSYVPGFELAPSGPAFSEVALAFTEAMVRSEPSDELN